ncbi:hypothetical protein JJB99_17350 [Bradyrhizobium diazoefficiens]|uniref:hypothetical protein n=1 Tax=Bradyrhizobium diazoefficiens TaxID=1355477 RepID=UPI00190B20E0|nr:hypothetical protein [Bradyrhizobium diazoefficiens]QQO17769.1 hypothetical protein JJB99_17350 [Bradyrhizobium diazoefficiens]
MSDLRTQIAASLFQEAPGGYVYREPYGWPFKRAPHYLVTEDQKLAIVDVVVPRRPILWQVALWSTLCLFVAIDCVALWLSTGHATPTGLDFFAILVLTAAQVVAALAILFWWKRRRLAPLIATLTPTDLQITQSDMRKAATDAMSGKQLMFAGVASVFASVSMLINGGLQLAWHHPICLLWIACGMVFARCAWFYLRQLVIRAEAA